MFLRKKNFEYKSAELVGIYIDNYKVFRKEFISLHPLIEVVEIKNKFINLKEIKKTDPFLENSLNVKIIVGDNGTGKSTILDLLKKDNDFAILLFKDAKDNFASTKKFDFCFSSTKICCKIEDNVLFYRYEDRYSHKGSLQYFSKKIEEYDNENVYGLDENEEIVDRLSFYYSKGEKIFDFDDGNKLFTNFDIYPTFQLGINTTLPPFGSNITFIDKFEDLFAQSPLDALCVHAMMNSHINVIEQDKPAFNYAKAKKIRLKDLVLMLREKNPAINWIEYDDLSKKMQQIISSKEKGVIIHSFSNFEHIYSEMKSVEKRVCNWFKKAKIGSIPPKFYYFRPYKIINKKPRFFGDLSMGEKNSILNKLRLYPIYKNLSSNCCYYLLLDEPDKSYHPKWGRCFWKDLIQTNKLIKKIERKKITRNLSIIATTHSPFLLSDAFSNNLIQLKKEGTRSKAFKMESTFAGNIGEMYYTHSFMDSTIGKIAEEKINEWILMIDNKKTSEKELENIKEQIEEIEDKILRNLLLDKISYRNIT